MKKQIIAASLFLGIAGTAQAQTAYTNPFYGVGSYTVSYGYYAINLKAAQTAGYTGKDIKVAVFDTGLYNTNTRFTGNTVVGYNVFNGTSNTNDMAGSHGTFVSGIIAANMSLGSPANIYGIAPLAKIMPIQIANTTGAMSFTDKQLAAGINYAINNGAKIFNNSWNGSMTLADMSAYYGATKYVGYITNSWYPQEIAAWRTAASKGIINVWAAGNESRIDPGYYAALPTVVTGLDSTWITVVGTDMTGKLASWSNACGVAKTYCMAAPGDKIISTYGTNNWATGSGTSFAAPMVSGAAALMMQKWPTLTGNQIQQILFTTANKAGVYADTTKYGQGMLDLTKAFSPVGTLTVKATNGTVVPLTGSYIASAGAVGSMFAKSMGSIVIASFDDYKRDYQVNTSAAVMPKNSLNYWGDQMALFGADEVKTKDGTVIAGTANGLRSSFAMVSSKDGVGAAFGSNISPSLAYGAFANGSVRGSDLVLLNSVGNPYMNMAPNSVSTAMSYGNTKIGAFTNTVPKDEITQLQRNDLPQMAGGIVEHTLKWEGGYVSASLGIVSESNSILGTRSGGALSLGKGANTAFTGITTGFDINDKWAAFGGATMGYSMIEANQNSIVGSVKGLTSGNAFTGITKSGIFNDSDRLGLVVSMPMRVNSGTATLNAPTGLNMDGNVNFTAYKVGLTSNAVEFSTQAFYNTELSNSQSLGFGLGARFNAQDLPKNNTEIVGMVRHKMTF
jgi:Subtilase family